VIGDVMSLDKLPGVAEVAMQSGLYAGHRVSLRASGRTPDKPFRYRDLGSAAYISRGRAVVTAGPLRTGGFIAWWIWLFIHIAFLTGYRNRVGAVLTWWVAFTRDDRKERAFTVQEVKTFRDAYTHPLTPGMPEEAKLPGEEGQPGQQAPAAHEAQAGQQASAAKPGKPVSAPPAPPPPRQAR
jgi:hypothetical protein